MTMSPISRRTLFGGGAVALATVAGLTFGGTSAMAAATGYTTAPVNLRSGPSLNSTKLLTIPGNVTLAVQWQVAGDTVSGTYTSNYWGYVTYNGKSGYVSRAYVRIPDASGLGAGPAVEGFTTDYVNFRTGPSLGSTTITTIPGGVRLLLQGQTQGDHVSGTYNTHYWAKTEYQGRTGWVSRAYVRVPNATGLPELPNPNSGGGSLSAARQEVINRALNWVNRRIPYSMNAWTSGPDGGSYRTDCSGMVAMAYRLNDQNYYTGNLTERFYAINKNNLVRGDIIGNLGPGSAGANGHVVIFDGWVDSARTRFRTIEQAGGVGASRQTHTWGSSFWNHQAWRRKGW